MSPSHPELEAAPAAGRFMNPTAERALMTRCLAYLFGAGAMLALATLPTSTSTTPIGILVSQTGYALAAVVLLTILIINFSRLPMWTFQLTLGAGTALISAVIYDSGDPTSAYTMFYLWIVLYAFYFFRLPEATLQMLAVALAYGAVLLLKEDVTAPATRWLVTVGTLAVAALLIALLKHSVEKLVARLTETARTDSLTGLMNRRGFDESFDSELERAKRSGQPLGVVLLDLDYFKTVNDEFGHEIGDNVLERVGAVVRASKRRIDTAARFGGEEFALLLPYNEADGSYTVAERIREGVREAFAEEPYELTVSLGVAGFPIHGVTTEELLRSADRALYTAKRAGRDRSVMYSTSDHETPPEPASVERSPALSGAVAESTSREVEPDTRG